MVVKLSIKSGYTLAGAEWGCSLMWATEIPVPNIKIPCYFCGEFCESSGILARRVKTWVPKYQKFPDNPCI